MKTVNHLQAVLDLYCPGQEAGAFLKQRSQLVHICHLIGVLKLLHPQFNGAVVDVVNQQLKDGGAHILQLNRAVVGLFEVGGEHGAEETALCGEHQPVQVKLFAVHGDGDVCEQAVLQTQVHDALHHPAGVGAVGEGVSQEVVLFSHRAPDTEAPLLAGLHLCCSSEKVTKQQSICLHSVTSL